MNQNSKLTDQKNMHYYVDSISFAALEASLFLDTHPDCSQAVVAYDHLNQAINQALEEYSKRYTPLTQALIPEGCYKKWVYDPWPWEKEGC